MSLNFNMAAIEALWAAMLTQAEQLGVFDRVITHEPKSAPGKGVSCSIWLDGIAPEASSGLAAVSGRVTFHIRIYSSFLAKPEDDIDPQILTAACGLMAAYAGGFTLRGTVRDIDLMQMAAQAGYLDQDGHKYRVLVVTVPVVINDLWTEAA